MGKRANIARTARNTEATAKGVADLRWQERRGQLVEQGLIEFNTSDGVVRALERRLAQQRGERVQPIGNPTISNAVALVGLGLAVLAFVLSSTGTESGVGFALLLFMVAFVMIPGGLASAAKARRMQRDEVEFAAHEARRHPADAPTVALPVAPAREPAPTVRRHAR